jgi:hypothetical protein
MNRSIAILCCVSFTLSTVACSIEPSDERPGLGLSGELVTGPVESWSFTDEFEDIFIETQTGYFLPHSVTIWCAAIGTQLYIAALDPEEKHWVANVRRDPNVRLKIGDRIYEQRLEPITDAGTISFIDRAFENKYGGDETEPDEPAAYWRVVAR